MKLKLRNILIIILILFSISSAIYLYSITRTAPGLPDISPIKPKIIQNYKGKYSISVSFTKDQFNFPEKLPFIEYKTTISPVTKEYFQTIATSLKFPGEPTTIEDPIDGTTYFWKNERVALFSYSKSRKIRYSSTDPARGINKQLSDASISAIAKNYTIDHKLLGSNSFQIGQIKYLEEITSGEGFRETVREKVILFQVSILPGVLEYEIISPSSTVPSSYIQIRRDGTIYSFQITVLPAFGKGITEYQLKNFDEIKTSLNEAVLIELRGNTAILSDLSPDLIQTVDIKNISIAYFAESPLSTSFQPIYKLSGEALLKDSNQSVAVLYLPAIK